MEAITMSRTDRSSRRKMATAARTSDVKATRGMRTAIPTLIYRNESGINMKTDQYIGKRATTSASASANLPIRLCGTRYMVQLLTSPYAGVGAAFGGAG